MTALSKVAISMESLGGPGCERGGTAGVQGNSVSVVGTPLAITMSISVPKSLDRPVCEGRGMAGVQGNSVSIVGTPLAVTMSVSVSKSLDRPVCEGRSMARVQGNAVAVGLSTPLAVSVSNATVTKMVLGHSLEGASMSGMGLADGVLGVQLMAVDVVTVLKGRDAVAVGLSAPLAVSVSNATVTKMILGHSLEGASMSRMWLADGVLGVQLMTVDVVTVLKGGDAVAVGLSAPLAVSMAVSVSNACVSPGHLLVGSREARVGLADMVSGGAAESIEGLSAPLSNPVSVGPIDG